jgi:hypothetical protein
MVAFAALGGYLGSHLGDGHAGMVILIGGTLGVLLPGSVAWIRDRARRSARPGPPQGAA